MTELRGINDVYLTTDEAAKLRAVVNDTVNSIFARERDPLIRRLLIYRLVDEAQFAASYQFTKIGLDAERRKTMTSEITFESVAKAYPPGTSLATLSMSLSNLRELDATTSLARTELNGLPAIPEWPSKVLEPNESVPLWFTLDYRKRSEDMARNRRNRSDDMVQLSQMPVAVLRCLYLDMLQAPMLMGGGYRLKARTLALLNAAGAPILWPLWSCDPVDTLDPFTHNIYQEKC